MQSISGRHFADQDTMAAIGIIGGGSAAHGINLIVSHLGTKYVKEGQPLTFHTYNGTVADRDIPVEHSQVLFPAGLGVISSKIGTDSPAASHPALVNHDIFAGGTVPELSGPGLVLLQEGGGFWRCQINLNGLFHTLGAAFS